MLQYFLILTNQLVKEYFRLPQIRPGFFLVLLGKSVRVTGGYFAGHMPFLMSYGTNSKGSTFRFKGMRDIPLFSPFPLSSFPPTHLNRKCCP